MGITPLTTPNGSVSPPSPFPLVLIVGGSETECSWMISGTVSDGIITLVFGNLAASNIRGKKVSLRPGYVPDAPQVPISWVCGPGKAPAGLAVAGSDMTDIPVAWLPVACRP